MDLNSFDWGNTSKSFKEQNIKEIFEGNDYEKFFEVKENDVVVDLGASVGPFTYSILNKKPKHCYVVEPLSSHIKTLQNNLKEPNITIIQAAITDKKRIEISWDDMIENVPTLSFKELRETYKINHIDFLKVDCEGGEYDVFSKENIDFLKTVPKIVTEFHLWKDESLNNCRFKYFRDNILQNFLQFEVYSIDGINIKWDLYNEHFLEYYKEILIYINNK
jgi:FkbM family methyltransferase